MLNLNEIKESGDMGMIENLISRKITFTPHLYEQVTLKAYK